MIQQNESMSNHCQRSEREDGNERGRVRMMKMERQRKTEGRQQGQGEREME